jgi:cytochrome c551/c552
MVHMKLVRSVMMGGWRRPLVVAPVVMLAAGVFTARTAPQEQQAAASANVAAHRAMLDEYCVTCHNDRAKTGGLSLENVPLDQIAANAAIWEKVIRKLEAGTMPPKAMPHPDAAKLVALKDLLESTLDRVARDAPNPGRVPIRRLNRNEYANAVRDLLDLEIDVKDYLPPDDEAYGFDNIADVLKVSPALLEQYLVAARDVSALAVGDAAAPPVGKIYHVAPDLSQERHVDGLPLGTRGGTRMVHQFPLDAEYDFRVSILRNIVGYMTGFEFPHQLEIAVDGVKVFAAQVGGEEDNKAMDANLGIAGDMIDARLRTRVPVKAGPHVVTAAFVRKNHAESDEPLEPFTRNLDLQDMNGVPLIDFVEITGPFKATGPGDTPSRRRLFTCKPAKPAEEVGCARKILTGLARRAYRRPATEADVETLLSYYQAGRNKPNADFDTGIQNALRLVLSNPKFLFRSEADAPETASGASYRVTDLDLAARISFFLWSSLPDDELIAAATQGRLRTKVGLETQVKRMLSSPKAGALTKNFAGQWLYLRNLAASAPDSQAFPNFDDNLRQAFRRETELFFESILKENRSVLDLMNADYTFVNERLAKHYGIKGVYGTQFRRVKLADEARRGLLGKGSTLLVTAYPTRTSPVLRGKWILENVLGTPPPAPPPNVPALKENTEGGPQMTMRQLMEQHRSNPTCSACHQLMDPIGFVLESYDGVGAYRTREPAGPIDTTGELADGTKVNGVGQLRQALMKNPNQFAGTMTEKMLTYALGRGLESYDMPVVRSIVRDAARSNYRMQAVILGIINSGPFRMRNKGPEPAGAAVPQTPGQVAAR